MSNSDVQAAINQVRSQLNKVLQENQRMIDELNALSYSANAGRIALINTAENANNALNNSNNVLNYSHSQLKNTFNIQLQIREMYFIFKDVETANKKIRSLTNKLYFDYKNQATIRKIVRGFMDNIDLNMVSDNTIYKSIEKEYLQCPDYWLGFVLLAIMYWKNNNKEKAEQCVNSAVEKNPKSTAIFFMLFNLKLKRLDTALNWFQYYRQLDKTGNDNNTFLMFVSSLPTRIKDLNEKDKVSKCLVEYIKEQFNADSVESDNNELVSMVYNYFLRLDNDEVLKYEYLRQYISEAQTLANALSKAKNNEAILAFIEDLNKVHLNERNLFLSKYMDELISTPSEAEQVIIDEIKLNEEIIASMESLKNIGDDRIFNSSDFKKMALENNKKRMKHDYGKLNFAKEVMNWVYVNKNLDINSLTNWNLFSLTKGYVEKAYTTYKNVYNKLIPNNYHINIKDFSTNTDFKDMQFVLNSSDKFYKEKVQRLCSQVKDGSAILNIVIGILLLIIGIILTFIFNPISLILSGVGFVLGVIGCIKKLVANPKKRKYINEMCNKENIKTKEIINCMFKEMQLYQVEFKEADDISKYVDERINEM